MKTKYEMQYIWIAPNGARPRMTTVFEAKNKFHARNKARKIYEQALRDAESNPKKYGKFEGYGVSEILPSNSR